MLEIVKVCCYLLMSLALVLSRTVIWSVNLKFTTHVNRPCVNCLCVRHVLPFKRPFYVTPQPRNSFLRNLPSPFVQNTTVFNGTIGHSTEGGVYIPDDGNPEYKSWKAWMLTGSLIRIRSESELELDFLSASCSPAISPPCAPSPPNATLVQCLPPLILAASCACATLF